jgi:hypothetical protein
MERDQAPSGLYYSQLLARAKKDAATFYRTRLALTVLLMILGAAAGYFLSGISGTPSSSIMGQLAAGLIAAIAVAISVFIWQLIMAPVRMDFDRNLELSTLRGSSVREIAALTAEIATMRGQLTRISSASPRVVLTSVRVARLYDRDHQVNVAEAWVPKSTGDAIGTVDRPGGYGGCGGYRP